MWRNWRVMSVRGTVGRFWCPRLHTGIVSAKCFGSRGCGSLHRSWQDLNQLVALVDQEAGGKKILLGAGNVVGQGLSHSRNATEILAPGELKEKGLGTGHLRKFCGAGQFTARVTFDVATAGTHPCGKRAQRIVCQLRNAAWQQSRRDRGATGITQPGPIVGLHLAPEKLGTKGREVGDEIGINDHLLGRDLRIPDTCGEMMMVREVKSAPWTPHKRDEAILFSQIIVQLSFFEFPGHFLCLASYSQHADRWLGGMKILDLDPAALAGLGRLGGDFGAVVTGGQFARAGFRLIDSGDAGKAEKQDGGSKKEVDHLFELKTLHLQHTLTWLFWATPDGFSDRTAMTHNKLTAQLLHLSE